VPARPAAVYETVVYAGDVPAASAFYADALGLRAIPPPDEHSAAFRLDDGAVLLLFDPAATSRPGRFVPSHGATGEGHVAFRVADLAALDELTGRLADAGAPLEREITWPRGGTSRYFRDPAGTSVELVLGEIWGDPAAG
jgi:catechol 2,3-dioxygenase-like lactoylglutathione lyase family enzyme